MTEALTPMTFKDEDYVELQHVFAGGNISKASKTELERYAVLLSRPHAYSHFGSSQYPQMCDSVRTLIMARISEEANKEATRISTIALVISIAALIAGVIQAYAAFR